MKVYLAGRFGDRFLLRGVRDSLQAIGVEVTSRWIDGDERPDDADWTENGYAVHCAERDLEDISRSDVLVLYTTSLNASAPGNRGGLYVELGYAMAICDMAQDMNLYLVGPQTNVFTYLPTVKQFDTWEDLYGALQQATADAGA